MNIIFLIFLILSLLPVNAYGVGVHFATSARHADRIAHSPPDAQGHKHIYYCRVLTGVFTRGQQGMKEPPEKDPNRPGDRYDAVANCNTPEDPRIFVVFGDNQAYPEYLVTFTQRHATMMWNKLDHWCNYNDDNNDDIIIIIIKVMKDICRCQTAYFYVTIQKSHPNQRKVFVWFLLP